MNIYGIGQILLMSIELKKQLKRTIKPLRKKFIQILKLKHVKREQIKLNALLKDLLQKKHFSKLSELKINSNFSMLKLEIILWGCLNF